MRNPLLSLILVGLIGCSETGQAVGEAMVDADNAKEGIIKLDNGNHYEAMVSMSEEDKACVREQCADATADEATAYMRGPEYDADPVGPAFDVERMIAAHRDGVPESELKTRTWALSGPALPDPMRVLTGADA